MINASVPNEWRVPNIPASVPNQDVSTSRMHDGQLLDESLVDFEANVKLKIESVWNSVCAGNPQFKRLGEGADSPIPLDFSRSDQRSKFWCRDNVRSLYKDLLPEALELFQSDFNKENMISFYNKIESSFLRLGIETEYHKLALVKSLGVTGIELKEKHNLLGMAKESGLFPDIQLRRQTIFIIYDPYNSVLLRKEIEKKNSRRGKK